MALQSLIQSLVGFEAKRKRLYKKAPEGPLKDFLSVPFPALDTPIQHVPILVLDFETTGLDAQADKLLSVGFVTLEHEQIKLSTCYHQIIKTTQQLEESNVIIHHITVQACLRTNSNTLMISMQLRTTKCKKTIKTVTVTMIVKDHSNTQIR